MAAAITDVVRKLFRRNKQPPLVCSVELDHDANHIHTAACFIDVEPLAAVELFQSQSCQACAPALPGILEGSNHPNLLLLSYNLTIFDHLGWQDTFGNPQWDSRQRAYVKKWNRTSLFTPMVVASGVADGPGVGPGQEVRDIVSRGRALAGAQDWHIYVDTNDTDVRIDSDRQEIEPHDILVVTYDPQPQTVKVGKGPNKGKKLAHRNVVKEITKIGEWTGGNVVVPFPVPRSATDPALRAAVIVQGGQGGPIVGVAKV